MIEPPARASVSAAILAGGHARRMHGADKGALDIDGRPILDRQLAVLRQLTADLLIVTRADAVARTTGSDPREDLRVVADLVQNAGPLGGLYTALVYAAAPVTIVVAGDMPFLSLPFLRHLVTRVEGVDVAVPRTTEGYHPLCAAYAHTAKPFVERQLARGELTVQALFTHPDTGAETNTGIRVVELGPEELALFDPDGLMLSNVNTPHDYRQACSRALNR